MKAKYILAFFYIITFETAIGQCAQLADYTCNLHQGCKLSDCSSWSCSNGIAVGSAPNAYTIYSMTPLFRSVKFKAKFNNGCQYSDYHNDWQKLMKISELTANASDNTPPDEHNSNRLGWKWNTSEGKIELGLYSHINHTNSTPGREFLSFEKFVSLNTFVNVELIMCYNGMYTCVDGKSLAIKRIIFPYNLSLGSGITDDAYFEDHGTSEDPAPHDMEIQVNDINYDCIQTFATFDEWGSGSFKGFANSVFYSSETVSVHASDRIEASLTVDDPNQSHQTPYNSPFTVIESGSNVIFTAGNSIELKPGFHAVEGSSFHAYICTTCRKSGHDTGLFPDNIEIGANNDTTQKAMNKNSSMFSKNDNTLPALLVSPNPNNGKFKITLNNSVEGKNKLIIFNLLGEEIYRSEIDNSIPNNSKEEIDLSSNAPGIYFAQVQTREKILTQKVVIQ